MEAIKELSDPVKGIKGFGKEMFAEMVSFADKHGAPEIRNTTSPAIIRLLQASRGDLASAFAGCASMRF